VRAKCPTGGTWRILCSTMENLYNGLSVRDDEEQGVEVWVESKEVKTVSIESEDDQARR
jgi:hypothetical protein